jgi:flagellar hook-associated protein FlgK
LNILFYYFDVPTLYSLSLIIYTIAINQLESNLEAITRTIAQLKKDGCTDEKILNELREEREKILKDLNL